MNKLFAVNLFLMLLIASSCGSDQFQIDRKVEAILDTLYPQEAKLINVEMDSICELRFEEELDGLVDSIKAMRKKQIEEKIGQLKLK